MMHAVVHAEVNALMFRNCIDLKGCTIYTTLFPCLDCAKTIIRAEIKTIYFLADVVDEKGEKEWDDPEMDETWKQLQKERPEKTTFIASRALLQKHGYKSVKSDKSDKSDKPDKSEKSEGSDRCCKRYRPSKEFKVELYTDPMPN